VLALREIDLVSLEATGRFFGNLQLHRHQLGQDASSMSKYC